MDCQASVPRDAFPPTPPGPEGSNGNGLLRVQWVAGAWLKRFSRSDLSPPSSLTGLERSRTVGVSALKNLVERARGNGRDQKESRSL